MAIQLNLERLGAYEKDLFKIKRVHKKNDMKEAQTPTAQRWTNRCTKKRR